MHGWTYFAVGPLLTTSTSNCALCMYSVTSKFPLSTAQKPETRNQPVLMGSKNLKKSIWIAFFIYIKCIQHMVVNQYIKWFLASFSILQAKLRKWQIMIIFISNGALVLKIIIIIRTRSQCEIIMQDPSLSKQICNKKIKNNQITKHTLTCSEPEASEGPHGSSEQWPNLPG